MCLSIFPVLEQLRAACAVISPASLSVAPLSPLFFHFSRHARLKPVGPWNSFSYDKAQLEDAVGVARLFGASCVRVIRPGYATI